MSRSVIDELYQEFLVSRVGKEILRDSDPDAVDAMNELAKFLRSRVDDRELWIARDENDDGAMLYTERPEKCEVVGFSGFTAPVAGCASQTLGMGIYERARVLIVREAP